jgi:hypothetical protein
MVLIGFYILFGRFFVDAKSRERTVYGVTNERILIVSGLFSQQVKSLQLRTLTDVTLSQKSDGSGTITFGPTQAIANFWGGSLPGFSRYTPPAFEMIQDAKGVYDVVNKAQKTVFEMS